MTAHRKLLSLCARNTKCYFKNRFMFFISMITPLILLVLYATFLRNVYIDSFKSAIPENFELDGRIIEGITGAWLMSSILSVSAVTVAFCSNIVMVEDKMSGAINDFYVSPVKRTVLSVSYFIANFLVTLLVLTCIMLIGFIYLAAVGWYIPAKDVFMIFVDLIINVLFGTLLAGVIENFIKNQGGISAVSTLVSSMYGFISGAYMPISQYSPALANILCCLPGTYGVGIMRNHFMGGYITELSNAGVPDSAITGIKDAFDINLYVAETGIPLGAMYGIILGACALLLAAYVTVVIIGNKKN